MSQPQKISKTPHVNSKRFRKSLIANDQKGFDFFWNHVDLDSQADDFLLLAAEHASKPMVERLLGCVQLNSQSFTDSFQRVIMFRANPNWQEVLPLFLQSATVKTTKNILSNYLLFNPTADFDFEVVRTLGTHLSTHLSEESFYYFARKCAQNNRVDALKAVWEFCPPKDFFAYYETWDAWPMGAEVYSFLSDAYALVQRDRLSTALNTDENFFSPYQKKM